MHGRGHWRWMWENTFTLSPLFSRRMPSLDFVRNGKFFPRLGRWNLINLFTVLPQPERDSETVRETCNLLVGVTAIFEVGIMWQVERRFVVLVDCADTVEDGAIISFVFKYSFYTLTYRKLCEGQFKPDKINTENVSGVPVVLTQMQL
jgi:hypothetical protein